MANAAAVRLWALIGALAAVHVHAEYVRECRLSSTLTTPAKYDLTFCTEYSGETCCTVEEDAALSQSFEDTYNSLYGVCPGCLANYKRMRCAILCSPDQVKYSEVERNATSSAVISGDFRICNEFCGYMFDSCRNATRQVFDTSPPAFCASSMDTNTGISIQVSHYDCYGVAENNQCEGGFFIQPKDTDVTNAWIIAAVIVVVVAALAGIVVVISMYIKNSGSAPGGADADDLERMLPGEGGTDSVQPGGAAAQ